LGVLLDFNIPLPSKKQRLLFLIGMACAAKAPERIKKEFWFFGSSKNNASAAIER